MLVTNGSRISTKDIPRIARDLDHLAVSIDTIEDATARAIGRGSSASARHALRLIEAAKAANMGTKINLVINAENWEEDLRPTLLRAAPDRIKVFRALHVPGVNDAGMRKAAVTDDQWALARDRYASIGAVCEDNEDMIESYAMLDASGRFFQNGPSGYIRSRSILDAPVMDAFREVRMDNRKFVRRGGLYAWTR
jgi:radical S-adenosyl methionine domain-containing protein 2